MRSVRMSEGRKGPRAHGLSGMEGMRKSVFPPGLTASLSLPTGCFPPPINTIRSFSPHGNKQNKQKTKPKIKITRNKTSSPSSPGTLSALLGPPSAHLFSSHTCTLKDPCVGPSLLLSPRSSQSNYQGASSYCKSKGHFSIFLVAF